MLSCGDVVFTVFVPNFQNVKNSRTKIAIIAPISGTMMYRRLNSWWCQNNWEM